jgi:transposase
VVAGDDRRSPAGTGACGSSRATVGRVLGEARIRPHKVRGWLNRADDATFWIRAGQVCRLYLDPPPGTTLISVDEKTGIQAKSRRYPEVPARAGRDARREFEYVRHGTVSIIAAMNLTTGEVIAERIRRNDSQTFIRFLAMLDQMIPPHLRIHLIMDNGSSHTSKATRAWLAARPRFHVTYTPKHASWLNMIDYAESAVMPSGSAAAGCLAAGEEAANGSMRHNAVRGFRGRRGAGRAACSVPG